MPFLIWLAIVFGFFGLVEIRVMCSHCPHYAEDGSTLKMFFCTQCMNFACPLSGVPDPVRVKFFERNPVVAEAWNHQSEA